MSHADLIALKSALVILDADTAEGAAVRHLADALQEAERQLSAIRAQANDWLLNWPEGANAARDLLAVMGPKP